MYFEGSLTCFSESDLIRDSRYIYIYSKESLGGFREEDNGPKIYSYWKASTIAQHDRRSHCFTSKFFRCRRPYYVSTEAHELFNYLNYVFT